MSLLCRLGPALGDLEETLFETKHTIVRASTSRSAPASSSAIAIRSRAGCDWR